MVCKVNQLTGFYMIGTSNVKKLKRSTPELHPLIHDCALVSIQYYLAVQLCFPFQLSIFMNYMKRFARFGMYNLKNVNNTHGRVLLLARLQAEAYNFTKSNTLPWVFFTIFTLVPNRAKHHMHLSIYSFNINNENTRTMF